MSRKILSKKAAYVALLLVWCAVAFALFAKTITRDFSAMYLPLLMVVSVLSLVCLIKPVRKLDSLAIVTCLTSLLMVGLGLWIYFTAPELDDGSLAVEMTIAGVMIAALLNVIQGSVMVYEARRPQTWRTLAS